MARWRISFQERGMGEFKGGGGSQDAHEGMGIVSGMLPRYWPRHLVYGVLLVVLAVFLVWPIVLTVGGAVPVEWSGGGAGWLPRFSLKYFVDPEIGVLFDAGYREGLFNSLLIAVFTTVLCLGITLPMGVVSARYRFPGKGAVSALVLLPLILPPFVGAIGMQAILGRFGAVNAVLARLGLIGPGEAGPDYLGGEVLGSWQWLQLYGGPLRAMGDGRFWGVVLMEALHLYPILYLNITAALANLDPALDEAAENLGAGKWKRFWRCTLPLIWPGIFAGGTIVFIWSFTELGTPLMFDYQTVTPVQVFWGLGEIESNPRPFALVVVMLAVAAGLYGLSKWAFGGRAYAMQGKASIAAEVEPLRGWRGWAALGLFVGVTLAAVLPHLGVVVSSFSVQGTWYQSVLPGGWTGSHYGDALGHELAMGSIRNSLVYASAAMVLAVVMGLAIAYLTVRLKVRGGWLLDTLGMLPLAVPGLVMAFGYYAMSLRWPFPQLENMFNAMGFETLGSMMRVSGATPNPLLFLVVAYTIRRLPYILRSASAGLEQTSGQLEEAAFNLGASTATSLRRVVLPLIMANLIAGGILVFSFAMLEVSDSLILAEKEPHYPITKAIWSLFNRLGDGPYIASAMGVWGMALLTVTLVGASVLMGRKLGAVFRV